MLFLRYDKELYMAPLLSLEKIWRDKCVSMFFEVIEESLYVFSVGTAEELLMRYSLILVDNFGFITTDHAISCFMATHTPVYILWRIEVIFIK